MGDKQITPLFTKLFFLVNDYFLLFYVFRELLYCVQFSRALNKHTWKWIIQRKDSNRKKEINIYILYLPLLSRCREWLQSTATYLTDVLLVGSRNKLGLEPLSGISYSFHARGLHPTWKAGPEQSTITTHSTHFLCLFKRYTILIVRSPVIYIQ